MVGPIPLIDIQLWAMPIVITGGPLINDGLFSDHAFAVASTSISTTVPPWILTR